MTFADAVRFMSGLRRFGVKLGNDRMEELLRRVGNPHHNYGIAHVTGTKGKGSTTAMIAAILHAHGFVTGGYFSPYVYDLCERVQLNGQLIGKRDFARLVARLVPHVEAISRSELGQVTEFELKTALGFLYFSEKRADFAAIEVGIGGRLDATNVVRPLVSVITNVGLDHTDVLGDTVAAIAREKAGIIKSRRPVITAAEDPDAIEVIRQAAVERASPLFFVRRGMEPPAGNEVKWSGTAEDFAVTTCRATYPSLTLALKGDYQCTNAACAIAAVEIMAEAAGFRVCQEAVRSALRSVTLPGRFSMLATSPLVVADGAHNEISAQVLSGEVRKLPYQRLILVVGMLRGHDAQAFLRYLAPHAAVVFATQPTWRRAQPVEDIALAACRYCADVRTVVPPLDAARQALSEARPDDLVLITGSFYTVGDVPPAALFRVRKRRSATSQAPAPRP